METVGSVYCHVSKAWFIRSSANQQDVCNILLRPRNVKDGLRLSVGELRGESEESGGESEEVGSRQKHACGKNCSLLSPINRKTVFCFEREFAVNYPRIDP